MVVGEIAQEKDLVIIGGGPAGYTAAIRAAQLGREVLLIESNKLGGVCLHEGCMPAKSLTDVAKQQLNVKRMEELGFTFSDVTFDYHAYKALRDRIIIQLQKGIEALCAANKIELFNGHASFLDRERIGIENGHQFEVIRFQQAIIATGATQITAPNQLTVSALFQLETIPASLILVGFSYIILEAAFAYRSLGSDVWIIMDENFELSLDIEIMKELKRIMKKRNITIIPNAIQVTWDGEQCIFYNQRNEKVEIKAEHFYSEGKWHGQTDKLGIERLGVLNESGFIPVNHECRTNVEHIFAVGDVTGAPLLALKGMKQGKTAAEAACGIASEVDLTWIPTVVQTDPPLASVGYTENQAIAAGFKVKTGQFPLASNGYAVLTGKKNGITKVIFEEGSDRLLGVHMFGEGAVELISSAVFGLEMGARDEDLLFPLYPHPSMNEAILEAVEQMKGQAIHFLQRKK
ncbi:FAD-dependent oxidoreductase [Bacillus sp. FJAT-50079]|uniref:dihydrolipoyl dehydrogenase family protein n=1 Tax=Bacillus sp. FJAT-50079 TaxID=2833577 RepID=UPI001BC983CC|nr:FAD-dependent oxidoreductase [Bacillus sp. FJAT-50079]MBS4210741.1 FAD-dependent oxidoreductase [Bacillus sp. FJAT-50079]